MVVAVDNNDRSVFPPVLPAVIAIGAFVLALVFVAMGRSAWEFVMRAAGTVAAVATLFTSLYPRVMVSSTDFANSLTRQNASSAQYTLAVMTVVAVIVTPVVLLYQGWTYYVFRAHYVFRARVEGRKFESPTKVVSDKAGAAPVG